MTLRKLLLLFCSLCFSINAIGDSRSPGAIGQQLTVDQLLENLRTENYSGERIDIELDNADIETLLHNLERYSGAIFEVSPDVGLMSGNERAYEFKDVAWDRILSLALRESDLEAVPKDGRVYIQPKGGSQMQIVREDQRPSPKSRGGLPFLIGSILLVSGGGAAGYFLYRKRSSRKEKSPRKPLIDPEAAAEVVKKITYLFEVEKIYRREDISIGSLSDELSIPPYQLSWIINEKIDTTFSTLVNSFRVEEVKKGLIALHEKEKTILDIAYEAGFATKTSFNRVFKKYTRMTPSQYRERNTQRHSP